MIGINMLLGNLVIIALYHPKQDQSIPNHKQNEKDSNPHSESTDHSIKILINGKKHMKLKRTISKAATE